MHLTQEQRAYVARVIEACPDLEFDADSGFFDYRDGELSWDGIVALRPAVRILRYRRPPAPAFLGVRVDQLDMGYYDRCLQHYCHQRLDQSIGHDQTCWVRHAEQTHCVGWLAPEAIFDDAAREHLLEGFDYEGNLNFVEVSIHRAWRKDPSLVQRLARDDSGWILFKADIPIRSTVRRERIRQNAKELIKAAIGYKRDRVLKIVDSIRRHGWRNDLAWIPDATILGYSTTSRRFFSFTGRHRIAAVTYLHRRGEIDGSTMIEAAVIRHSAPSVRQGRPHPDSPVCDHCRGEGMAERPADAVAAT